MRPDDVSLVVSLCRAKAGLKVSAEKTYLIESRLAPIARRESYASVPDLLAALRAKREESLVWAVVEAMTSSESSFFRDRTPFQQFETEIYPALARSRPGAPVKVWSAACAAGQEVYSLAMIVDRMARQDPTVNVELAASDLSSSALDRAQRGVYSQFEVQRGLPIRLLIEHFEKAGEQWRLSDDIRRRVRWRRINLIAGLGGVGRFDVVFCRNVLSGLDMPFQAKVLNELALVLPPDGVLVLGLNESVAAAAHAFLPTPGQPGVFRRNPEFRAEKAA